ncbi:hypothetical protein H4R99_003351 [Coemansia sp. RSA 1722]|nr:hypothetical protein LPJ57_001286 [Coemansia sp. RSA 486]KAJ2234391.1 hypothetical protein IWW45_003439 [Coemansia sp. RSA 485]KAJ2600392.1 hypothetical protein H4R99_003351 [Coemansia sp. RSA 1722]
MAQTFFPLWPTSIGPPTIPVDNIVKSIDFDYAFWHPIKFSVPFEMLQKSVFGNTSFPAARSLKVNISLDSEFDNAKTIQNLDKLLRHLCSTTPNIVAIDIQSNISANNISGIGEQSLLDNFILGLSDRISKVTLSGFSISGVLAPAKFTKFSELTHLRFACNGRRAWFDIVVRKNFNSLRYLRVSDLNPSCVDSLLFNDSNKPIIYPSLETLWLGFRSDYLEYNNRQFCHFPVLKKLDFYTRNAVCSNSFFINSGNLERLGLFVVPKMVRFAEEKQVFKQQYFSGLKTLSLSFFSDRIGARIFRASESDSLWTKNMLQMPSQLNSLKIMSSIESSFFMPMIDAHAFSTVQLLGIEHTRLDFSDIVNLLQKTPCLCDFRVGMEDSPPSINDIYDKDIVDYIKTSQQPLSKHLSSLTISCEDETEETYNYSLAVALFVIGCPKLSTVFMWNIDTYEVIDNLHDFAESADFEDFADRINNVAHNIVQL